jgi:hypothetical protein
MTDWRTIALLYLEIADGGPFEGGAAHALSEELRRTTLLTRDDMLSACAAIRTWPPHLDTLLGVLRKYKQFIVELAKLRIGSKQV